MLSLLAVYAIEGFYPFGNGSIAALDLYSQYIPLLYRFYDVVTGIKNPLVDLHVGGGMGLYSDTVTEILNPFNYVLLLGKAGNIYRNVNLLFVLYSIAASVTAYIALDRLFAHQDDDGRGNALNCVLALAYGMSYYIAYQYEIIRWMYIVVLFPLFYLACKRLFDKGKPVSWILLQTYILVLSLQFGVQTALFSAVYFTFRFLESRKQREGKTDEKQTCSCAMIILSYIAAVMMSGIVTIPTVINLIHSARSVQSSSVLTVIMHHGLDNIGERLWEITSPATIGIILACLLKTRNCFKKYRYPVMCLVWMIVTVILEPSNLLWHLGSYQCFPVRYGYMVLWLAIVVSGLLMRDAMHQVSAASDNTKLCNGCVRVILLATMVCIAILPVICVFLNRLRFAQAFATLNISNDCPKETIILWGMVLILAALSAVITFVALSGSNGKKVNKFACFISLGAVCICTGIMWNLAVFLPQNSEAREIDEAALEQMAVIRDKLYTKQDSDYADEELYTGHSEDVADRPRNASLITGEYSMTAYLPSGEGLEYVSAMKRLGYDTPWVAVLSKGGLEIADRYLGIGESDAFAKALRVSGEQYNELHDIYDYEELMDNERGLCIMFNNRRGEIRVTDGDIIEEGVVLLPVAYSDGWKCEQGKVISHLGGFLAIEVCNPTDEIVISYSVPGIYAGMAVSLAGIVVLLLLGSLTKKNTEKVAEYIYRSAVIAAVAVLYVLPNIGMLAFMGCKAVGYDLGPYLEKGPATNSDGAVLLYEDMQEDGLHVLIGRNNLVRTEKVKMTASDSDGTGFGASEAADGDSSNASRWSSENNRDNHEHYLQAGFKESKSFSALRIYWERNNACRYNIEVSDDGQNWRTVSEFDSQPVNNPQIIYYDEPVEARFVRLHVWDVAQREEDLSLYYQNVSVCEFEIYSDDCDSFVIDRPVLESGHDRVIPVPAVPEGYSLEVGGINYGNLKLNDKFADTIAAVDINLGYVLNNGDEQWQLTGFDVTLPACDGYISDNDRPDIASSLMDETVPKEWKGTGDILEGDLWETIKEDVKNNRECKSVIKQVDDSRIEFGSEGYEIEICSDGQVMLRAATDEGMAWAEVTLRHLCNNYAKGVPCGMMRDYPEYEVRGFVMDVARRPISTDMLYEVVDDMNDNYMNTLQLHLNDNAIISMSEYDGTVEGARQLYSGFRLESHIMNSDGVSLSSEDGAYSYDDIVNLVKYAKKQGVSIVPEIDTPAHSLAITKLYPEFGYDSHPEMADTLDISKPEAVELTQSIWAEYLTDTAIRKAMFEQCNAVHIGMDEYYGDNDAYADYCEETIDNVRKLAPDKTIRMWGSFTFNNMSPDIIDRDVQVMIWNPFLADPKQTFDSGLGVVNCLNRHLYIIVDGGTDRLDTDNLMNNWEPNVFEDEQCDETLPKWSDNMLGACYALWNDNYCNTMEGPKEEELMDRIEEPLGIISSKLWGNAK